MGTVQRDEQVDFDEAKERKRVARENLAVIESLRIAEVQQLDLHAGSAGRNANGSNTVVGVKDVEADALDAADAADDLHVSDAGAGAGADTDARLSSREQYNADDADNTCVYRSTPIPEQEKALVRIQSVWDTNINADDFTATISTLTFDPLATDGDGGAQEPTQAQPDAVEDTATQVAPGINVGSMKVVELRSELKHRGLETKGKKAALLQRLQEALSNASPAKSNPNDKMSAPAADVRSVSTLESLESLLKAVADGRGSAVVTIDIKKKGLGDEGAGKVAGK